MFRSTNERTSMTSIAPLPVGTRVEIHPRHDAWMRGDRFGVVVSFRSPRNGQVTNGVRMDRSRRVRSYVTEELTVVGEAVSVDADGPIRAEDTEDTSEDRCTDHGYDECPDCGNVGVKVDASGYVPCTRFLTCWADPTEA